MSPVRLIKWESLDDWIRLISFKEDQKLINIMHIQNPQGRERRGGREAWSGIAEGEMVRQDKVLQHQKINLLFNRSLLFHPIPTLRHQRRITYNEGQGGKAVCP